MTYSSVCLIPFVSVLICVPSILNVSSLEGAGCDPLSHKPFRLLACVKLLSWQMVRHPDQDGNISLEKDTFDKTGAAIKEGGELHDEK